MWKAGTVTKGATWGPDMSQQERSAQLAQVITAMSQLQRLYYDTAFSDPMSTFPSLLALVEPSQLLFGSDYPWAGEGLVSLVLLQLASYQGLDQQTRRAIERDNALSLFPRFAAAASASACHLSK